MKIRTLQNLSLVDYPGHLAATVFLQGCNFYCGYCQNPELIPINKKAPFISEKEVLSFLDKRADTIEGVVITGGEPLIYSDLPDFLKCIREKPIKLKLDTNGSNPQELEDLLRDRLIDYIALDIKTSLDKYHLVTGLKDAARLVKRSIFLTILSTVAYEFRTTCVPGIVDEKDFLVIGELIKGAKKYCLQQFRPQVTYDRSFQNVQPYPKEKLRKFKTILEDFVDVVEIRGI